MCFFNCESVHKKICICVFYMSDPIEPKFLDACDELRNGCHPHKNYILSVCNILSQKCEFISRIFQSFYLFIFYYYLFFIFYDDGDIVWGFSYTTYLCVRKDLIKINLHRLRLFLNLFFRCRRKKKKTVANKIIQICALIVFFIVSIVK
jgi:hypothetical protein